MLRSIGRFLERYCYGTYFNSSGCAGRGGEPLCEGLPAAACGPESGVVAAPGWVLHAGVPEYMAVRKYYSLMEANGPRLNGIEV